MKKLLLSLFFLLFTLLVPLQVFAANYGECGYGAGTYNNGGCPTPVPTPTSTTNSPGDSGSSGSLGGSGEAPVCSTTKPSSAPDLFQINAKATSLTLFFSPASGNRDRYYISYGTHAGSQEYGFEFENSDNGVVSVDVKALKASSVYYFKVRAGNGCMPGDWSNELAARTGQRVPSYKWRSLPKIVANRVARIINPSAVKTVDVDTKTLTPVPSAQPLPLLQPPSPLPQDTTTQESSPSLLDRIGNFFKGLFGS